jgi:hypothetical protein
MLEDGNELELSEIFNKELYGSKNHLNSIISIKPLNKNLYPGLHLFTLDIFCFLNKQALNKKQTVLVDVEENRVLYYFQIFDCNFSSNFLYQFPEKIVLNPTQNYNPCLQKYYIYQKSNIYSIQLEKNEVNISKRIINYDIDFELQEVSALNLEFDTLANNIVNIRNLRNYYMVFYDYKYTYIINTIFNRIICKLAGTYLEYNSVYIGNNSILLKNENKIFIYDFISNTYLQTLNLETDSDIFGINVVDDFITVRTAQDMKVFKIKKKEIPLEELCNVCYTKIQQRYAIIPCGHTRTCISCLDNLNSCPMCRNLIETYIKIYE